MATISRTGARRRGRLVAAIAISAAVAFLSAANLLVRDGDAANPPDRIARTPVATPTFSLSPTPNCSPDSPDCPSPTPSEVVVSPVAPDASASPTTQPYLQGTLPSPSPSPQTDTTSSAVPLGGGFVDQLPTPSSDATNVPTGSLAPHQSGLPLPFIAIGAVLILAAAGSLIYALAPRRHTPLRAPRAKPTSPVMFTPYGPDSGPGTNLLTGKPPRPPGPKAT